MDKTGSRASRRNPEGTPFLTPPLQGFPLHDVEMQVCEAPRGSAWTTMGLGCGLLRGLLSGAVAGGCPPPCPRLRAPPPLPCHARPTLGPGARHERPVGERALLPFLLPTLPWPHCCQARLLAARAHLLAGARARARACWSRGRPFGDPAGLCRHPWALEAPPDGAC